MMDTDESTSAGPAGNQRLIYRIVYYFNLFDHPVKLPELANLSGLSEEATLAIVGDLLAAGLVEQCRDLLFIPGRAWIVPQREADEACFRQNYKKIRRAATFLSHMPFVRGILLTGRTSKGVLSEYDDFDFLVLVEKDRARQAWILLFLLRRLVSLNYRNANFKWFCCNYILSEDHLALQERDVFIAMELVSAHPVFNAQLFEQFRQANPWRHEYFHQRGSPLPADLAVTSHWPRLQRLVEYPCRLVWTDRVRRLAENYYQRRWLKLGIVKDEKDCRAKAGNAYVKPDTGARRKFIIDRVTRLNPAEHNSFLRTKINLHRALIKKSGIPDLLVTHANVGGRHRADLNTVPAKGPWTPQNISAGLQACGYVAEFYDITRDRSPSDIFRQVKAGLIALIGIHVEEATRRHTFRMIALFHGIGARVIVFGPDATAHAQLYLEHEADVVVVHGGVPQLVALLDHINTGNVALEAIPGIRHHAGTAPVETLVKMAVTEPVRCCTTVT